jgi:leader peptidase (prepilin peptidase)/N-methyltransferase
LPGEIFAPLVAALVGACIGSFVATLASRAPESWSGMWLGRSRCPACKRPLQARDLVPLLSWLGLRGRCRYCGADLGLWYPAIELAAAAIGLISMILLPSPVSWLAALLGWWLLALAAIDLVDWTLPDSLTLPLVLVGLLLAISGDTAGLPALATPFEAATGAALGYGSLAGLAYVYRRVRGREGLGLGDAKLLAAAGAWLGPGPLPTLLLGAALLGLVMAVSYRRPLRAETALPFGPPLALASWAGYLFLALSS